MKISLKSLVLLASFSMVLALVGCGTGEETVPPADTGVSTDVGTGPTDLATPEVTTSEPAPVDAAPAESTPTEPAPAEVTTPEVTPPTEVTPAPAAEAPKEAPAPAEEPKA